MLTKLWAMLLIAIFFSCISCAPRFRSLGELPDAGHDSSQFREHANGNAFIDIETGVLDTILYVKKLNGGLGAQAVGDERAVVVPTYNERIYFLNPKDGKVLTSIMTKSTVGSAVAMAGELIYFAEESGGDLLTCFNVVNGKRVWQKKIVDPPGAPIIDAEDLYITSRNGVVSRINRWTGEVVWQYDANSQCYGAPSTDEKQVYIGTAKGELLCLSKTTGKRIWEFKTEKAVYAQPLVDRYVFSGAGDGKLYAIDPVTGKQIWSFMTSSSIHTTPVLNANRLLIASNDKMIYCLSPETGDIIWKYETDAIVQSSPIATVSSFICANSAGSVYQFDLDGKLLKSFKLKGSVTAPVSFIDGKLYVVTRERMLYCLTFTPLSKPTD